MNLVCFKCKKNSIPAPPGATENTRYVCRECSPLGSDDLRFDRSAFDSGMLPLKKYGPEARFAADSLSIFDPPSDRGEAIEIVHARILAGEEILLPAAIQKALLNGDASWARAVTAKNLIQLPERMFRVFLLFYWGDYSHAQIASEMSISESSSLKFLLRAKERLERLSNVSISSTTY